MTTVHRTLFALAAAAALAAPAQAATYSYTGDSTNSPTWWRPLSDFSDLAGYWASTARYDVLPFTVSQTGSYSLVSTSTNNWDPQSQHFWDNYTFLYQLGFNPSDPLSNGVVGNDDYPDRGTSGFTATLTAGTQYFHVTTGFHRANFGAYLNEITGPGSVITAAVPEPSAYLLMGLGLAAMGVVARRQNKA